MRRKTSNLHTVLGMRRKTSSKLLIICDFDQITPPLEEALGEKYFSAVLLLRGPGPCPVPGGDLKEMFFLSSFAVFWIQIHIKSDPYIIDSPGSGSRSRSGSSNLKTDHKLKNLEFFITVFKFGKKNFNFSSLFKEFF